MRAACSMLCGGRMKVWVISSAMALAGVFFVSGPASAGVYSDDMGKCLVEKTSDRDKIELIKWVFSAISASDAVKEISTVTASQREQYSRAAARMMDRLVIVDCHKETVAALKYEGEESFKAAFDLLGRVAVGSLMSDPAVGSSLGQLGSFVDADKWKALIAEAGRVPKTGTVEQ